MAQNPITYTLLQTPIFVGYDGTARHLWEIQAILPTGIEHFVLRVANKSELGVHQAICNKIAGNSPTIGQNPLSSFNGQVNPPKEFISDLQVINPDPAAPKFPIISYLPRPEIDGENVGAISKIDQTGKDKPIILPSAAANKKKDEI